ncbi:MAG: DUF3426 domain-containing protein [Bryobacterales bacterium]|nr:DUF3426 domain-containing protein [Bryobacterales bacterium]
MAPEKADKAANARPLVPVPAVVVVILLALGVGAFWFMDYWARTHPSQVPVLTPEAKAYVVNLKLSDVQMQAAESYLKQAVVEIIGNIGNNGPRTVKLVEINCVFYDSYGQLVLRERVAIAGRRAGSLAPGETKKFRVAFDNLPPSWNQSMPQLVIAQILFE